MQVKDRKSIQLTNHGVSNSSSRHPECGVMYAIGRMHVDREWGPYLIQAKDSKDWQTVFSCWLLIRLIVTYLGNQGNSFFFHLLSSKNCLLKTTISTDPVSVTCWIKTAGIQFVPQGQGLGSLLQWRSMGHIYVIPGTLRRLVVRLLSCFPCLVSMWRTLPYISLSLVGTYITTVPPLLFSLLLYPSISTYITDCLLAEL